MALNFGCVFYGISTSVGYLMPNPIYMYVYDLGGNCGVIVTAIENGHGNMNSNLEQDDLHFT